MSDQNYQELDYQTVRRRVARRFVKRLLFAANAVLWLIFLAGGEFVRDIGVAIFWLLLLAVHFVYAFEIWSRIVDGMTQREIESLQRKGYHVTPPIDPAAKKAAENAKLKREQVARLADDGEIVYDESPETPRNTGRRGRNQ